MKFSKIVFFFFIACYFNGIAQNATITGIVLDEANTALSNVNITSLSDDVYRNISESEQHALNSMENLQSVINQQQALEQKIVARSLALARDAVAFVVSNGSKRNEFSVSKESLIFFFPLIDALIQ